MLPGRFSFASMQGQGIVQRVEPQSAEAQESIRRFFQLPWFGRRWVVQEAVLNPVVVFCCGLTGISWPRLHLAIESLPDCIWNDTSGSKVRKSLQKLVISGEHGHIFPKQRLIASPSTFWVHFIISSVKKIKTGSMPLLAWQAMFKHQPS
jgi:hypothetical protein